jgi:tRNA-specific 2-thiouridylase
MSGGVDSSTVAAMLKRDGVDCVGLTMQTWPSADKVASSGRARGCCSVAEILDAERVAWRLGIPHYTLNIRNDFEATVIDDFVSEYVAGRTPNPCVRCNQHIKFELFLERARGLGADRVATGHYARIRHDADSGRWKLLRGLDHSKDQSYVLYPMTQEHLSHALFPLGELTKAETRQLARDFGLAVADKQDSVEICFVPHGHYGDFVAARRPDAVRPGPVVTESGEVLGEHRGLPYYTIGQRKGLGVSTADPLYVLRLEPKENRIVVGPSEALNKSRFVAIDPNWISFPALNEPRQCMARIRYNSSDVWAEIAPASDNQVEVHLAGGARAIAPGQAVVFYDNDEVLGGATIDRVIS